MAVGLEDLRRGYYDRLVSCSMWNMMAWKLIVVRLVQDTAVRDVGTDGGSDF